MVLIRVSVIMRSQAVLRISAVIMQIEIMHLRSVPSRPTHTISYTTRTVQSSYMLFKLQDCVRATYKFRDNDTGNIIS